MKSWKKDALAGFTIGFSLAFIILRSMAYYL